jgi:phosphotransferase system HPr-like phosphotransfer protein
MRICKIMLNTIEDVKALNRLVSNCPYDVELVSGRYAVDAKSIMGIFSLDLSKPIALCAHFDDADRLFAELERFKAAP